MKNADQFDFEETLLQLGAKPSISEEHGLALVKPEHKRIRVHERINCETRISKSNRDSQ